MTNLKLYNTLTKQKEDFVPINTNNVRMYVCGMTVYDYPHLGHARIMVVFDVLARWIRFSGYNLTYVRNITDIDDKIIHRACENNENYKDLTSRMIKAMRNDENALLCIKPDIEPCATEYIADMLKLIKTLIDKDIAYQIKDHDVFFAVDKFSEYGKLSCKKTKDLVAGSRVEVDCHKNSPLDFVLWKQASENEPHWSSEFGNGRPGWHIECSAMSMATLGESFDIHGGGPDLLFPHHENEIAQSEAATGKQYAKYWLHAGPLRINGNKMSKSLNNFFTIKDMSEHYSGEVLRFFLISSHYRSHINFDMNLLEEAKQSLTRLYLSIQHLTINTEVIASNYSVRFITAMNDDLNTPAALSVLFEMAHDINKLRNADLIRACKLATELKHLGGIMGILANNINSLAIQCEISDEQINQLVNKRLQAKINKDYKESDRIRDYLKSIGVVIEDTRNQTSWRRI